MKQISLFAIVVLAGLLTYCGVPQEEHDKLKAELKDAQQEVADNQKYVSALQEVSALMDSIDIARDELQTDIETGSSPSDYVSRMQNIQEYIQETEQKIDILQSELQKSEKSRNAYAGTVSKLRKELAAKGEEVIALQAKVEETELKNQELLTTISVRDSILLAKDSQIEQKKEELAQIEAKIEELLASSKMSEADFYFLRATSMEETASRTKFAPKKKKATLQEALTLYEIALNMGRSDAQSKIDSLQQKI